MNYSVFTKQFLSEIQFLMPENLRASLQHVEKNNGITLIGVTVDNPDEQSALFEMCPVVYLEGVFDRFCKGEKMEDLVKEVANLLLKPLPRIAMPNFYSWETMKSQVFIRLCNTKRNESRLNVLCSIPYMDLSILFYCEVEGEVLGPGYVTFTEEMVKTMGVSKKELYETALKNTKEKQGEEIQNLNDYINEQMGEHRRPSIAFLLSTKKGVYGAAVLLYSEEIRKLSRKLNTDLYIVATSVNELILIPVDQMDLTFLSVMIHEISERRIDSEEILSESIYLYSQSEDVIGIIRKW